MSDDIDVGALSSVLVAPVAGPVIWVGQTGSTNDLIALRARDGADEGLVIGTDFQTAGRGRRGRTWAADPGASVLFSVLLRPRASGLHLGVLPITAAVGVAGGLAAIGVEAQLVWPNDLTVDGRKLGGILCELSSTGGEPLWAVVGVGINVTSTPDVSGGRWTPVSVAEAATAPRTRQEVLTAVLSGLSAWFGRWYDEGDDPVLAAFAARDALAGRSVEVARGDRTLVGRAGGLGPGGVLRLHTGDGELHTLTSGEVIGIDACPAV
jgi:BirA family biotin operon repressor/biotin-[acetyl-CoA-carboxylase] ligase